MLVIRRCVSKQAQNLNEVDTLSGAKNDGIYKHIQFKQEMRFKSRYGNGSMGYESFAVCVASPRGESCHPTHN